MKWTLRKGKPLSHVGCANNLVTISGLVIIEIKFSERCALTQFFFFFQGNLSVMFVVALYKTYVRMYISWIIKDLCTLCK